MLKPTQHSLDKLEELFHELGYKVRYEKGNFKPGSCILLASKVIVANKFATIDVRINSLLEILNSIDADPSVLSEPMLKLYSSLKQQKTDS
jgi:hypothetical protein